MTFNELMQTYVNMPYEELVGRAQNTLIELIPVFDKASSDGNGSRTLFHLLLTSLAVDGKFSTLEYKFLNDVFKTDISYDEAKDMVASYYSDGAQDALDEFIDSFDGDLRAKLLELATCALAVDETINKDEVSFITKLISK